MSKLDAAIQGVPPTSPPAPAHDPAASPPPQGNEGGQRKERTPDEVRGEVLRKLEESNSELKTELAKLQGLIQGMATAPVARPKAETLDDMSLTQLRTARAQVTDPAQAAALDDYIRDRTVSERVDAEMSRHLNAREFTATERTANEAAMSRWPELRDKSSALYRLTNRIINDMGTIAETDPRAVLNAANEAGMQLGLTPKTSGPRPAYDRGGNVVTGHDHNGPGPGDPATEMTPEYSAELDSIAGRLAGAMPAGKFTPEQLARIKKNALEYRSNASLFVRR